jgi:hypothetical protein
VFRLSSDLNAICEQARLLANDQEPSWRVWNSIETALRREGLIRDPQPRVVFSASSLPRTRLAWLRPVSVALVLVAVFVVVWQFVPRATPVRQAATSPPIIRTAPEPDSVIDADEVQWLNFVGSRAPAMRAGYESDLRAVNAYIRDAKNWVRNDPNDEIAQQYLMNAYEQRAMLYEMAMDRALP